MKFIFIIFFIFFDNFIYENEENNSEVEVINLYESKTLDQMVLENLNDEEDIEDVVENSNQNSEIETNEIEVKQIEYQKDNFIHKNEINNLKVYFDNMQNINSKALQKQIIDVLENTQLNFEIEKDKEIFFLIVNYFKSIGQISKSYDLIERFELSDDKKSNFYTTIKINYLLSTFQLNEACSFKEDLNSNIQLDYFFLEKIDIFCLILNDNQSEANLLNSILIETEKNLDNYYQYLISIISNSSDQIIDDKEFKNFKINKELIFLYSAMTRIAELFYMNFMNLIKKIYLFR